MIKLLTTAFFNPVYIGFMLGIWTWTRIKLESKKIANETLRYIMELVTGGVICTKAFEVVTQKQEQISTLQKLDERIEASTKEIEEEGLGETTTNGIF